LKEIFGDIINHLLLEQDQVEAVKFAMMNWKFEACGQVDAKSRYKIFLELVSRPHFIS